MEVCWSGVSLLFPEYRMQNVESDDSEQWKYVGVESEHNGSMLRAMIQSTNGSMLEWSQC